MTSSALTSFPKLFHNKQKALEHHEQTRSNYYSCMEEVVTSNHYSQTTNAKDRKNLIKTKCGPVPSYGLDVVSVVLTQEK
jgi:hypothetical protein